MDDFTPEELAQAEAQALFAELWWDTFVRVFPFTIACMFYAPDDISRMRAKKEYLRTMQELECSH